VRRLTIISIVIFISLCFACTPRKAILNPLPSEYISQCRPVEYDVAYAQDIILSESLHNLIKRKLQEYMDDKESWSNDRKKVKLSITITHIETPSSFAAVLAGPASPIIPPSKMSGKVIVYYENKEIGRYKVDASCRTFWPMSLYVDLEERIAGQFANEVMQELR
jgi:hypothetical protein